MGYTHYWRQLRDFTDTEWNELARLTKLITTHRKGEVQVLDVSVDKEDPDTLTISNDEIRFNGIGEDGHETFILTKKKRAKDDYEEQEDYDRQGAFDFCKTAQKPYDKYVVAVLCALYTMDRTKSIMSEITSDGRVEDWNEGLEYAVRSTRQEYMTCPILNSVSLSYLDYLDQELTKEATG